MFGVYNQRIRYIEMMMADGTSASDTKRQQLFYIIASDFGLHDNYGIVYDTVKHDISSDYERLSREQWGPLADTAIRAMLRRALHVYDPARFADISEAELQPLLSEEQAAVISEAYDLYKGAWHGDLDTVRAEYDEIARRALEEL